MANINDFKLVKIKSRKMFDYLRIANTAIPEIEKERIGFYHLIIENVTGIIDSKEGLYNIIDTRYNRLVNNIDVDDLGMDAVHIDEDESETVNIELFNFKYRESFKSGATKVEGDISRSTKFLEYIIQNEKLNTDTNQVAYGEINKIIEHLNSNKICNMTLYMVSNEANGFASSTNEYIKVLENNYGMKVVNISLDDIVSFFNEKKEGRTSSFMISPGEFLSFQSDEKSTQKSYILKLSLLDLIRITSNDEKLSNNYSIEEDDDILKSRLDFSLLYDNVRGFLGETKYNKNIIETLENNHQNFFMFNNGITLTAEKIECSPKNSGKKYLFKVENFQVVNGGQTLRSIYNFLNDDHDTNKIRKLREAYVLVRMFKIDRDDTLQNYIAEYTNSQNAISDVDLKSIDNIQIQLEKHFAEFDILYARKSGDLGVKDRQYAFRISMEKLAQVLYSSIGFPDRASNQKRRLFQDYYDEIFKSEKFSLENCKVQAEQFVKVEAAYRKKSDIYKLSDQKVFYILYIISFTNLNIEDAIQSLEGLLTTYEKSGTDSRKLIQKGFKDHINRALGINDVNCSSPRLLEVK